MMDTIAGAWEQVQRAVAASDVAGWSKAMRRWMWKAHPYGELPKKILVPAAFYALLAQQAEQDVDRLDLASGQDGQLSFRRVPVEVGE